MSLQRDTNNVFHIFRRDDLEFRQETGMEVPAICGSWPSPSRRVPDQSMDCPACVVAAGNESVGQWTGPTR